MNIKSTIDAKEVAKFAQHATMWWDTEGPLKTLHDINPIRIHYIECILNQKTPISSSAKYRQDLSTETTDRVGVETKAPSILAKQRILDIGCGGGILSEGLARCGAIVTGLDVEPDAINSAREHAAQNQLMIDYKCQAIETFNAEPFAIITCLEMLEHVQEPERIIEHAARLLAPGGYLFLSTINRTIKAYASVIIAAEYLLNIIPRQTHDFQKFIRPSELTQMTRSVGLETLDLSGITYNPFTRSAGFDTAIQANYLLACRKV